MKVLAIDTTTKDMMVAVITENEIFDASALNLGTHHSEMLCGAVADVLKKANVTFADMMPTHAQSDREVLRGFASEFPL